MHMKNAQMLLDLKYYVFVCRCCAHPDICSHRMSPGRAEELGLQLRRHADETGVPKRDRLKVQEEDRGYGPVSDEHVRTFLFCLTWTFSKLYLITSLLAFHTYVFLISSITIWAPSSSFSSPSLPSSTSQSLSLLYYIFICITDDQIHRSLRRKLLHVPSVASSYRRTNCCASPARTTCPTASPRYSHQMTLTEYRYEKQNSLPYVLYFPHFVLGLCSLFIFSGSSYAERRLVGVSSLWISCSLLPVHSVSGTQAAKSKHQL